MIQMFTRNLGAVSSEDDVPLDYVFWQHGNITISLTLCEKDYWVSRVEGEKETDFLKLKSLSNALALVAGWMKIIEETSG